MVIGLLCSKTFLVWMGTDPEVLEGAALYMKIIFLGVPGNLTYNYCASVLRASGDTKRPLIFLSISGLVNVGLNLVLVICFHFGVAGVAIATIASQYLSAAIILFYLSRQKGALRFSFRDLHFDGKKFRRILAVGIPCGIQGSFFSISNVLIQSSINSFGAIAVAGNGAGANIEGFVYTSMNALYQAAMTFTGQNVGARKPERLRRVLGASLLVVFLVWCIVGGAAIIFRVPLVSLYVS
jgi:putative MATE family efflux protein